MNLSKSKVIAGLQCLKRLYLQVHQPELAGEIDEKSRAVIEQGNDVGRLAQQMFPGGVLIEARHDEMNKALQETSAAVENDKVPAVFEATFAHYNVLARVDILERLPRNKWRLIEVKSSTKVKPYYPYDVAIQQLILEGLGMKVIPCLMHLNREYVYDGKQYELEKLFVIEDLTAETAALAQKVEDLIGEEREVLARAKPPDIKPGKQCTNPHTCEFYALCNKELPMDHVSYIPNISPRKLEELASQGIESIGKIPKNFTLTERQKRVWECARTGKPWFGEGIKEALSTLRYPIYFLDFETLAVALPRYAGMSPYNQIPFQWSLHIQPKPGADLEHHEFLSDNSNDPRVDIIRALCQAIGKKGSIVAYGSSFEKRCLGDLARWWPKYRDQVANLQERLWDPLPVIRTHVYDLAFCGSYSLKSVLPALVPGMSYHGMGVSEGSEAGLAWEKMVHAEVGSKERVKLRADLLAYCKQDTLAMVKLLEVLYRHSG